MKNMGLCICILCVAEAEIQYKITLGLRAKIKALDYKKLRENVMMKQKLFGSCVLR